MKPQSISILSPRAYNKYATIHFLTCKCKDDNSNQLYCIMLHFYFAKNSYGLTTSQRFRISGINAPEIFGKEKGIVSKKFIAETLLNKNILIVNKGLDSFRRILGDIYFINDDNILINIADLLVEKGLAEYRIYK